MIRIILGDRLAPEAILTREEETRKAEIAAAAAEIIAAVRRGGDNALP